MAPSFPAYLLDFRFGALNPSSSGLRMASECDLAFAHWSMRSVRSGGNRIVFRGHSRSPAVHRMDGGWERRPLRLPGIPPEHAARAAVLQAAKTAAQR
jgi:hypothetical protein